MSLYEVSHDGTVQIRSWRADDGHWSAAFERHPEVSFGGETPLVAAKRLVRSADGTRNRVLSDLSDRGAAAGASIRREGPLIL